ncbi:MAG TPA: AAA family ATPase [Asanoa sp.]
MLVGRGPEQSRIRELLDNARRGHSGVLLLRGEPGIGKTALLRYAESCAADLTVARVVGVESESSLPFAGLSALVRPLGAYLPGVLPRQRAALEAALALGPPVHSDRLAVAAATLALLAAAADDRPLLVLVDDAHWLDHPSREAVLFAARRLGDEGIAMLLCSRVDEAAPLREEQLPAVTVPPLGPSAAIDLLADTSDLAPSVVKRLYEATAGNPLALLAAPSWLTDDERTGRVPLAEPVRVGSAEAAFGRLAATLPHETRRALLVACSDGSGRLGTVLCALDVLGLGGGALAPAERAGIIDLSSNRLTVRHPLVRSAIYHSADPAERRAAHAALAAAYVDQPDADRRAWHLARAAAGPDEAAAGALEDAGSRACRRQGYAVAVHALVRASELSPHGSDAVRRLLAAAQAADLAGQPDRVAALTAAVAGGTDDPKVAADLALLRGRATRDHDPAAAAAEMERAGAAVAAHDAARESRLLLEAAMAAERFRVARAAELAERAGAAARRAGLDDGLAKLAHARLLHQMGRPVDRSTAVVVPPLVDLEDARILLWIVASNPVPDRDQNALVDAVVVMARDRTALGLLPEALLARALNQFYLGDWQTAIADSHEAIGLALAVDRPSIACEAHGNLARLHAFRGDDDECRTHLAEYLRLARAVGMPEYEDFAGVYLGELALTRGNDARAIEHFASTSAARTISRARASLIEAHVRVGREDEAKQSLAELQRLVAAGGSRAGRLFVPRLQGMLAHSTQDATAAFQTAMLAAKDLDWPLETARTELLFGERLRRDRQRRDARPHLLHAAELFDRLGARPWADRAMAELSATGQRLRRSPETAAQLTPQELQLARIIADGATNREAAERLFVSPKTVEAHLGAIYRKLGLRSRTELAARLVRTGLPR